MSRSLFAAAASCWVLYGFSVANATLLVNPGFQDPDLGGVEDAAVVPTGWEMVEGQLFTPGGNTAQINHFGVGFNSDQSIWYRPFEGGAGTNPAFADVQQSVPGVPGQEYSLTAWWLFESFYAGGIEVDPSSGLPQTASIQAIDFLDAAGGVLSSEELDIRLDGKTSDQDNAIGDEWTQHVVSAVAPFGTVGVRARLSMVDGISGPGNPQSVFVDDATLVAVPEPAALLFAALGCVTAIGRRR